MTGCTHIVGAGIAGLSAALAVTADGREAILYEAAPQAGGRCRTLTPRTDSGTTTARMCCSRQTAAPSTSWRPSAPATNGSSRSPTACR